MLVFMYQVEVKRTVPREDMHGRGVSRTRKVFVGGLPLSLNEGKSYLIRQFFSFYDLSNFSCNQIFHYYFS